MSTFVHIWAIRRYMLSMVSPSRPLCFFLCQVRCLVLQLDVDGSMDGWVEGCYRLFDTTRPRASSIPRRVFLHHHHPPEGPQFTLIRMQI